MTNIGAHVALSQRNGYSDFCRAYPQVVFSVDQGGALLEAKDLSGGHTTTIFRTQKVYGDAPGDIENPSIPYEAMAEYWFYQHPHSDGNGLYDLWRKNPADFYAPTNEVGSDNPEVLPHLVGFEREVMKLANEEDMRVCILNHATGSPGDFDLWKNLCAPFIAEAWQSGNIYGRHVYNIQEPNLMSDSTWPHPGNPFRPFEEILYLRETFNAAGGVVLSEVGLDGGYGYAGNDRFFDQMTRYERFTQLYQEIIGICMWTLGDWNKANWQSAIPLFVRYMEDNPSDPWTYPTQPDPNPSREPRITKHTIHLLPQQVSEGDMVGLARQLHATRSAFTYSHDVVEAIMYHSTPAGTIHIYDGHRWDLDLHKQFEWLGVNIVDHLINDPLPGLKIGLPFSVPHALTGRFNDPRNYANGLHEGIDYDVLEVTEDSKQAVRCGVSGEVIQVGYSPEGYGNYVVVLFTWKGRKAWLWYGHLDEVYVSKGALTGIGTALGEVGSTGRVTGEHVHITLQLNGGGFSGYAVPNVIDPLPYMTVIPSEPLLYDMGRFFMPPPEKTKSDIVILANNWEQGDERQQLQYENVNGEMISYVTKNNLWEKRLIGSISIHLLMDTSPGDVAMYTVKGPWLPRRMAVGDTFTRTEEVTVYKHDCTQTKYSSVSDIYFRTLHTKLTIGSLTFDNVAELHWIKDNRLEEQYFYAQGVGLIQWKKYNGLHSWATERIPQGTQEDNRRDPAPCT